MADPRVRQIKIKTGVVKRLAKEKVVYVNEAKQQEEKIERMKAEGCDEYDIKKQEIIPCMMLICLKCDFDAAEQISVNKEGRLQMEMHNMLP